jgi:hypothetical protein
MCASVQIRPPGDTITVIECVNAGHTVAPTLYTTCAIVVKQCSGGLVDLERPNGVAFRVYPKYTLLTDTHRTHDN